MLNSVIKIGSEILYRDWMNFLPKAKIVNIEICEKGERYGKTVETCDYKAQANGVVDLDDGHWCYFDQIEKVM